MRNPISQSGQINIIFTSDSDKDDNIRYMAGQSNDGTQGNLFFYGEADGMGGHPAQPKLARLQTPDTPLYLENLYFLSRETSYLSPMPVSIVGCNHPLFLCGIIVNDNGSLGVGRLLGLAKLGIGLGFDRTFLIFLEEGGAYATGF
jgi:hypothetical protein